MCKYDQQQPLFIEAAISEANSENLEKILEAVLPPEILVWRPEEDDGDIKLFSYPGKLSKQVRVKNPSHDLTDRVLVRLLFLVEQASPEEAQRICIDTVPLVKKYCAESVLKQVSRIIFWRFAEDPDERFDKSVLCDILVFLDENTDPTLSLEEYGVDGDIVVKLGKRQDDLFVDTLLARPFEHPSEKIRFIKLWWVDKFATGDLGEDPETLDTVVSALVWLHKNSRVPYLHTQAVTLIEEICCRYRDDSQYQEIFYRLRHP